MHRYLLAALAAIGLFGAVSLLTGPPPEAALVEQGAYVGLRHTDGPLFRPTGDIDTLELVWISSEAIPGHPNSEDTWSHPRSCTQASDPDNCQALLAPATERLIADGPFRADLEPIAVDQCIMCPAYAAFVFALTEDSATLLTQTEALALLGPIDTPAEAIVALGEFALIRELDDGYELLTTESVCELEGPRRTTWHISPDGSISQGSTWLEHKGDNCDDI